MEEILFNGIKVSTSFKDQYQEEAFEKYCKNFTKNCCFSIGVKLKLYALFALMHDGTYELQNGLDKIKEDLEHWRGVEEDAYDLVSQFIHSETDKELANLYEQHYYDLKENIQSNSLNTKDITVSIDWRELKKAIKNKFGIIIPNPFDSGKRINVISGFIRLQRAVNETIIIKFLKSLCDENNLISEETITRIILAIKEEYKVEIKNWQTQLKYNTPDELVRSLTNIVLLKLGY